MSEASKADFSFLIWSKVTFQGENSLIDFSINCIPALKLKLMLSIEEVWKSNIDFRDFERKSFLILKDWKSLAYSFDFKFISRDTFSILDKTF